jgi:hypothetical protein
MRRDMTKMHVLVAAVGLALVCLGASFYVAREEAAMAAMLEAKLREQEGLLTTLTDLIDSDGADAVVAGLVEDCSAPDRERFDYLLSNLQTLRATELREVDLLFARCGDFYAERRSFMVSRLERELQQYRSYIALYEQLDGRASQILHPTDTWDALVALEVTRATYTEELVAIQGEIITSLLNGATVASDSVTNALKRANETKENLSFAGVQRDALRQELP